MRIKSERVSLSRLKTLGGCDVYESLLLGNPVDSQVVLTVITPFAACIVALMALGVGKTYLNTCKLLNRAYNLCFRGCVGNIVDAKLVGLP